MKRKEFDLVLFSLLSFVTLFLSWYSYGVGDQIIHIPYVKQLLNPDLYPGDSLLIFMQSKPTFFWEVFLPLYKIFGIEQSIFMLQFFSALLFFYSLKYFTKAITNNETASYLVAIISVIPKFSFGYSSLFVPSHFIPRNLTIPLVILVSAFYANKRKRLSYFLLGLIGCLHILSAVAILVTFLLTDVVNALIIDKRRNFKESFINFASYIFVFSVGLAPLLVIKFNAFLQKNSFSLKDDYAFFYTALLDPFYLPENKDGWFLLLNGIFIIIFSYVWLLKKAKSIAKHKRVFLLSILTVNTFLVLFSIFSETVWKEPFFIQLQLGRSGNFTLLVFMVLLTQRIVDIWHFTKDKVLSGLLVISSMLTFTLAPLFIVTEEPKFLKKVALKRLYYYIAAFVFFLIIADKVKLLPDAYGINIYIPDSSNHRAQTWLRENTPIDAKVLSPFYIGGFTEPDFRVISERSNVITNADIVETILNVNMLALIKDRINDLTGERYDYLMANDKLYDYYEVREYYHTSLNEKLPELIAKYNLNYIVIESDYSLNIGDPVYENDRYKIYKISAH